VRGSRILGLGHHLPDNVVTNDDLAKLMDTSDEWITQRSGIRERRWVVGDVGATDLAEVAARQALDEAGLRPQDIDLVIFATLSPDLNFPGSSCLLQARLGVPGTATLDIRNQCTGFVYGLSIADQFIRTGAMNHVLLVGAEIHSTGLDQTTRGRDVTVLFGDGAGAAVVGPAEGDRRIIDSRLHADGSLAEILMVEAPASRKNPRLTEKMLADGLHYPKMEGRLVFKHAVERLPQVVGEVLGAHGYGFDDIDMLIPHQANLRINEMAARLMKLDAGRVFNNIHKYGNTTAASIPIALHEAVQEGRIEEGDLVVLAAFGAGLTWGANLIRW
jgi:3-oxoacyl-[acyl-carrier-protein] synthase III